jgi:hypothetical protein
MEIIIKGICREGKTSTAVLIEQALANAGIKAEIFDDPINTEKPLNNEEKAFRLKHMEDGLKNVYFPVAIRTQNFGRRGL